MLSEEQKLEIYKKAIALKDETDLDKIREVSCKFYRDGGCEKVYSSTCKGCLDEDAVLACKQHYLFKIFDKPQEKWTPEFDAPVIREKTVKVQEAKSLAQKCDTCYAATHCEFFKPSATCSIDFGVEGIDAKDSTAVLDFLISIQMNRLGRLQAFEVADGGMVDQNLSGEMDRLSGLIGAKRNMNVLRINQSAEIPLGDGSSGGGILSKIFGGNEKPTQKNIERGNTDFIEAEVVQEPVKLRRNEG